MADLSELSFEDAFRRLEETVLLLEGGELTIEEMIATFEEGMSLVNQCRQRLERAQARVALLTRDEDELVESSAANDSIG